MDIINSNRIRNNQNCASILIFTAFYLPGFKGGGTIKSIKNLVNHLQNRFDVNIITSDRDLCDNESYPEIKSNVWIKNQNVNLMYLSPGISRLWNILKILFCRHYNVIYFNSFFSRLYSMLPLLIVRICLPRTKVILAPRGEFSPGAFKIKSIRKYIYIQIFKILDLHKYVYWHVSTELEKKELLKIFNCKIAKTFITKPILMNKINVVCDISHDIALKRVPLMKNVGQLSLIFVSRISEKKNLDVALQFLRHIKGNVKYDIYGPIEDEVYWKKCKVIINNLPDNIKVEYHGSQSPDKVGELFAHHHVFLFPTKGENFGHVISEAMAAGCLPIISDQTPWSELKNVKAGWNIPLENTWEYEKTIQYCVNMNNEEYEEYSTNSSNYYNKKIIESDIIEQNLKMFEIISND